MFSVDPYLLFVCPLPLGWIWPPSPVIGPLEPWHQGSTEYLSRNEACAAQSISNRSLQHFQLEESSDKPTSTESFLGDMAVCLNVLCKRTWRKPAQQWKFCCFLRWHSGDIHLYKWWIIPCYWYVGLSERFGRYLDTSWPTDSDALELYLHSFVRFQHT